MIKLPDLQWQLAEPHGMRSITGQYASRRPFRWGGAGLPISQQVIAWLLFWPTLTLIARQAVYFAGPARPAEVYQNGAAMGGAGGTHYYLYVNLLFLFGFVLAGYREVWRTLEENPLIAAMLALSVCTTLWSACPVITLQICIQVGLCTLFGCYLSTRFDAERLMEFVIFMGTIAAVLSVFFALALPSYGLFKGYAPDAWQGICNHKNSLGISMAYVLSPIFFTTAYGRGRKLAYVALIVVILYKCKSVGAMADTAGMLVFVASIGLIRRLRAREAVLLAIVGTAISLVAVASIVHFWPILAALMGKDPSMTGRAPIYHEVWLSLMKRPILGYGFGGFWYAGNYECQRVRLALGWPGIGYSENGFLELALQSGFVGVGLVVAMLGRAVIQGMRLLRSPAYTPRVGWFLAILLLAALTNIEAGWLMTADTLDWVLILIACIGLNAESRRTRVPA